MFIRFLFSATLLALTPCAMAQSAAERLFVERTIITAGDEKCDVLSENERLALSSGRLQTRNTLLLAGAASRDVDRIEREAVAYSLARACDDPEFQSSIALVRDAFSAFLKTPMLEYTGQTAPWIATRWKDDVWRVTRSLEHDRMRGRFGLTIAPETGEPILSVGLQSSDFEYPPKSIRLFVRDASKVSSPWLSGLFSPEPSPPPRTVTKGYWAGNRQNITDEYTGEVEYRYSFDASARDALKNLDTRERIELVITPSVRSRVAKPITFEIEVGQFVPAAIFASLPGV